MTDGEAREMARELVRGSIIEDAASQFIAQILKHAHDERVKPLRKQVAALEAKLAQANAELASAMATEHQYGPRVAAAVDHAHMAMGDLQKATLEHVFAMRAVLRSEQAKRFDKAVDKALTGTGGR